MPDRRTECHLGLLDGAKIFRRFGMMYVWGVRGWRKLYYLGFDLKPDRNRIWVILTLVSIFRAFSLSLGVTDVAGNQRNQSISVVIYFQTLDGSSNGF